MSLEGIAEKAMELDADRGIVINRWNGGPGKIEFFQVGQEGLTPVSPILFIRGIRLRRELKAKVRPIRSLAITMHPNSPKEIVRTAESLANFLNLPVSSMGETTSKFQASMQISSDASSFTQITFLLLPETLEVGPRLTLSHVIREVHR
jgi:rRNA maturation protein Rpf1